MIFRAILPALMLTLSTPALAQTPEPAQTEQSQTDLQARAEAIQKTLRCVVCQNQSIADSNSPLAEDMRNLVEYRVSLGESEEEVRAYMQARYGDFVLMKPPMKMSTWFLWFGPLILVLLGSIWFIFQSRRSPEQVSAAETGDEELSDRDKSRLADILKSQDKSI